VLAPLARPPQLSAPVARLIESHGDRPFLPFSSNNERQMASLKHTGKERMLKGAKNFNEEQNFESENNFSSFNALPKK
jgi:hypothetical protein